jgi:drug/metabolite transporter (DMT)-like permease
MRIWAGFWLVALIWGSSFMLIRVGVEFIHPIHLVFIRTGIAAIGLGLLVVAFRRPIPRDPKTILALIAIGIINNLMPFLLITWGEMHIDSGLASVLQATAALFTLVMAHFLFTDERMTIRKTIGLICGFIGVVVLAARSTSGGTNSGNELAGEIAIVLASLCYAIGGTASRAVIKGRVEPVVVAAIAMMSAALSSALLIGIGGAANMMPVHTPVDLSVDAFLAVIVLGVVNTFVAYLIFYEIVRGLGAARASMVTYIVPAVGLLLGVIFLGEKMDAYIIVGAGLIFAAIGIVNIRFGQKSKAKIEASDPKPAPAAAGD